MGLQSEFAKAIHDKQLVVMGISGLFAVADVALNLHFSATQLAAGAGVVATYLGTSTYLAAKHAQGEHKVAATQGLSGMTDRMTQVASMVSKRVDATAQGASDTAKVGEPVLAPVPDSGTPPASTVSGT